MADVVICNLVRRFGSFTALDRISFEVREGEFLTLLGPSGCGKSTMLAALAGLDRPTAGRIEISDRPVFDADEDIFVDAQFRNLGLMFQSYALWPHMTVADNLAFPLSLRGLKGRNARERINETLELVDMAAYRDRYPGELSGGQQQRVALARTLVYQPRILLLDEPLSNLDAKLRDRARIWLRDLQRRTGVTTVYVTHDQTEALSLSDRIVVMNGGRIAQIGTPRNIYDAPSDVFVADFVGSTNLLDAELIERTKTGRRIRLNGGTILDVSPPSDGELNDMVVASIRPECIEILDRENTGPNVLKGQVVGVEYHGGVNVVTIDIGPSVLKAESRRTVESGTAWVRLPHDALRILPAPDRS